MRNPADLFTELAAGRRSQAFAIRGEHGLKGIRGRENQLRQGTASGELSLRRERVFHLVGKFAQFAKTASRGVTFESVDDAANPANYFGIATASLEFEPDFIEVLQQFRSALEEEFAEFCCPVLVERVHAGTSSRL